MRTRDQTGPADGMHPVRAAVRWLAGHVRGLWAALGLFLAGGLALAAGAAALFALIARGIASGATRAFDEAVVAWAGGHDSAVLDALAVAGAVLGSGTAAWVVLGVATLVFLRTRHLFSALLLWVAVLGARLLNAELKALFDRPRPPSEAWDLTVLGREIGFPTSQSFPSGHAVTSVVVFGTLAYLVVRLEPTVRQRRATLAVAAGLIVLIGLSRVWLGVHYPSDVLAGWLAGVVWATAAAFAIEVVRYFAGREPEVARRERDVERGTRPIREAVRGEDG